MGNSPFYNLSEADMQQNQFEVIVILEGIVESTGVICQARTSYLNTEILWGFRFMPMLFLDRHHFTADHSNFNSTYEIRMTSCSARDKVEGKTDEDNYHRPNGYYGSLFSG